MTEKKDTISIPRDCFLDASKLFYKKRQRPTKSIGHYIIGNKFLCQLIKFSQEKQLEKVNLGSLN